MSTNVTTAKVKDAFAKRPDPPHELDGMLEKYLRMEQALEFVRDRSKMAMDESPIPLAVLGFLNEIAIKSGEAIDFDPLSPPTP